MDITRFFSIKKLRRSSRLKIKEKMEQREQILAIAPLGYIDILPREQKFNLFRYLTLPDLSVLTLTSKAMRDSVDEYLYCKEGRRRMIPEPGPHHATNATNQIDLMNQFSITGLLLKRTTCLYCTKERLRILDQFLDKLICKASAPCQSRSCCSDCIALSCYGSLLRAMISGWDRSECRTVYNHVLTQSGIAKHVSFILKHEAGSPTVSHSEVKVRKFLHTVFLNALQDSNDVYFWLNEILQPHAIVNKARLLCMLYWPLIESGIQWYWVTMHTPKNVSQSRRYFKGLAEILSLLMSKAGANLTISIIEEMTSIPDDWLPENLAHLLMLCDDSIVTRLLGSRAINGKMQDIATVITSMCLVCVKDHYNMNWVVGLLHKLWEDYLESPKEKQILTDQISESFHSGIMDLHEFSSTDQHDEELDHFVTAMTTFTREVMPLAMDHLDNKRNKLEE